MWLSEVFTKKELEKKTRSLYIACRDNIDEMPQYFEKYFGLSYKLAFGNIKPKDCMLNMLKEYYQNEYYIKNAFIHQYLKGRKYIFEYPVNDSRADIIDLNDTVHCYEIKTKYDNYSRLSSQLKDYLKVFEYVSVICPDNKISQIKKIIPDCCGIVTYKGKNNKMFHKQRRPKKSGEIKKRNVLSTMNKKELYKYFNTDNKRKIYRKYNGNQILKIYEENMSAKKRLCK